MSIKKRDFKKLLEVAEQRNVVKQNTDKKLSLCMIVKNEEKNIARCLKSVEGVVDEIIVVDTGSTDKTVEIAKTFNAKVYHHEWENSFAKARNTSIDYATGDWILILDADEQLSVSSKDKIRSFLIDIGFGLAYELAIKNVDLEGNLMSENYMVRLFQNMPTTRYLGDIHEFIPNMGVRISINKDDITIVHDGYADKDVVSKKVKDRNIPLLSNVIEKDDLRAKSGLLLYKVLAYLDIQDMENAIKTGQEALEAFRNENIGKDAYFNAYVFVLMLSIYLYKNEVDKAREILEESEKYLNLLSVHSDYWYYKSRIAFEDDNYEQAINDSKKAIEAFNNSSSGTIVSYKNYGNYLNVMVNLSLLYTIIKDNINAEKQIDLTIKEVENRGDLESYLDTFTTFYIHLDMYDKAIELYKKVLDTTKKADVKKTIIKNLSNLYMQNKQESKAIALQATIHDPSKVKESWYMIAQRCEDKKEFRNAEDIYSEIIKVLPEDVKSYLGRFVARLSQGKQAEAANDLSFAVNFARSEEDKMKVGLLCTQVGILDQAKVCFNEILKENPTHYEANLNISYIQELEGDLSGSQEKLEKLISTHPDKIDSYIQLGNLFINSQNFSKATEIFNKANTLDMNNPYIKYVLAISNLESGNKADATKFIKEAIELEPNNPDLINLQNLILQKV